MLEIRKITKVYKTGDYEQKALDSVSLNFRKSEFASILGPSGSGKTTLLNIIGGLDRYTKGDLIINGKSTKKFTDKDWDTYRNNKVGFVFQNYNLITHQSILANVEIALTIAGISKKERKKRAIDALTRVGLKHHINKKPTQLSGGQMQRVAIARALINNPEIILADEPTGSLDTETSTQIMEILKDISKTQLVIMVTHNSDLAQEYSTRIIKLTDGKIIGDSNPYNNEDETNLNNKIQKKSMSFLTALSLSFKNLLSKKGRTILVAFSGSIGIIGIALIMSLSNGFQKYINDLQEETLSSYPFAITANSADMTSMLLSMREGAGSNDKSGKVTERQFITSMFSNIRENDLKSFKNYLELNYDAVKNDIKSIRYAYAVSPNIYTIDATKKIAKINPSSLMTDFMPNTTYSDPMTDTISSFSSVFNQMVENYDMLEESYEVLAGHWPTKYDEMVIVLPEPNSISDLLVYSLGLRDVEELNKMISNIMTRQEITIHNEPMTFTYEDLMNVELKLINKSDMYKYNEKYDIYEDMSEDESYMEKLYQDALKLKIVGIVSAKEGNTSMALAPGVAYTKGLTEYIINQAKDEEIVKEQLSNPDINVFSGHRFDDEDKNEKMDFDDIISIDTNLLTEAMGGKISEDDIKTITNNHINQISSSITTDIKPAKEEFLNTLKTFTTNLINEYIANPKESMPDPFNPSNVLAIMHYNNINEIVKEFLSKDENQKILNDLTAKYLVPKDIFENTYSNLLAGYLQGYIGTFYNTNPSLTTDVNNKAAVIIYSEDAINTFLSQALVIKTAETLATNMTEAVMKKEILTDVGNLTSDLMQKISGSFKIDKDKIAKAFKMNLSDEEIKRIMDAMMTKNKTANASSNLTLLGYQDLEEPSNISFYFNSFDGKENFLSFIDKYNTEMENAKEDEKVIRYTDTTGILMSSVKTIVNIVSYVLMAFVSISLIVSSIMIAIITYISVLERTKEIGVLRAVGASKKDITHVFNAETIIEGLLSGIIGVVITVILNVFVNILIKDIINVPIISKLPVYASIGLIILSVLLDVIAGFIPSKMASKKDPVEALRSE